MPDSDTPALTGDNETGMVLMPRGNVQEMLDIITGSLDYGSDFLDQEQIETLRSVAEMLGLNPMAATPTKYSKFFPHACNTYFNKYINATSPVCRWCGALPSEPWHLAEQDALPTS